MQPPIVLLIDGDPDALSIYSILLEHHGYRVLCADNGDDGLRQATDAQPHLIILEPSTPTRCGTGLLAALREDPATTTIPLIVLTAGPRFLVPARFLLATDRLLTKPMPPLRLLGEIEQLLASTPSSTSG